MGGKGRGPLSGFEETRKDSSPPKKEGEGAPHHPSSKKRMREEPKDYTTIVLQL